MAQLSMNLLVHGVPQGQKMWGVDDNDRRYLSTFYGRNWNAKELMLVEVMNLGSSPICYYSYVIGNNVCAADGRAGSYFALTLKINVYYADLENMFNILKAAYKKMCIGIFISENEGNTKFKIKDFSEIDLKLKQLEKSILTYIGEYSNNSDLMSLQGFASNGQTAAANVSLLECNLSNVLISVKSAGKVAVSSEYPDAKTAKVLKAKDEEVAKIKSQARQEIEETHKSAELSISQIRQKSTSDLAALKKSSEETLLKTTKDLNAKIASAQIEADKRIADVKAQFADADIQIKDLKQQKKDLEKSAIDLTRSNSKLEGEVNRLKSEKIRLDERLQEYKSSINQKRNLIPAYEEEEQPSAFDKIRKYLPFVNCFLLIIVLIVAIFLVCCSVIGDDEESNDNLTEKIDETNNVDGFKGDDSAKISIDTKQIESVMLANGQVRPDTSVGNKSNNKGGDTLTVDGQNVKLHDKTTPKNRGKK